MSPITRSLPVSLALAFTAALAGHPSTTAAQGPAESCRPAAGGAAEWLARADETIGATSAGGRVLRYRAMQGAEMSYQSDRTYPPFFSAISTANAWYDPATGVERLESSMVFPGIGPTPARIRLAGARSTWMVRDTAIVPVAPFHSLALRERPLNPWAVIGDWRRARDTRVEGECRYRDYLRLVLARSGERGVERLYLDPKTGYPVKLDRREPHYLWGDVHVEYLWTNWKGTEPGYFPGASFRLVDGAVDITRTIGEAIAAPRDSAPALTLPDPALAMPRALPLFLQPLPPDTVRVGPTTFLLVNPGYTQAVALVRDTVWVLDATQGEARARQDSAWIGKLFPGRHPVAVVVTDLAWPHVAGVRYWVATGATIVSHRVSRPFLEQVVARRWQGAPDLLERRRSQTRLRFRAVDDSLVAAGGGLRLQAIDGIGSEGALVAWLPGDRFLWAGDYIQTTDEPSLYAAEVWRAARRAGLTPERVAAQHLRLTDWAVVDRLVGEPAARTGAP